MSSTAIARGKALAMDLAESHLAVIEPWRSHPVVRPLVLVFAPCLVAAALFASAKSPSMVIERPALVEPVRHIVNVANKGSRLESNRAARLESHMGSGLESRFDMGSRFEINAPVVAATDPEPAVIRNRLVEPEALAVRGKPTYGLAS